MKTAPYHPEKLKKKFVSKNDIFLLKLLNGFFNFIRFTANLLGWRHWWFEKLMNETKTKSAWQWSPGAKWEKLLHCSENQVTLSFFWKGSSTLPIPRLTYTLWAHIAAVARRYYRTQSRSDVCCEMDSTLINVQICLILFEALPLIWASCNKLWTPTQFPVSQQDVLWLGYEITVKSEEKHTRTDTQFISLVCVRMNTHIHPDTLVLQTDYMSYRARGDPDKVWGLQAGMNKAQSQPDTLAYKTKGCRMTRL